MARASGAGVPPDVAARAPTSWPRRSATTASATTATTSPRSPTPSSTTLVRELEALADEYPELDTGDSPLAEVGRAAVGHVRAGAARRADAVARQRVRPRRARSPGTRASSGSITDPVRVRRRAQARRPRDLAALRATAGSCAAATRGDGEIGEDVTANVATIAVDPATRSHGRRAADAARGARRGVHAARRRSRS